MKIRTRVSLWYACILVASLVLMAGALYVELVVESRLVAAAGKPKEPMEEEIIEVVLIYGVPTAIGLLATGWWLMRRALTPLDRLTEAAERIHASNLHERLPRSEKGDELDRLTEVFNAMMARLQDSFSHIREFTLHASHELKTPLAILHVELETLINHADTTQAQRDALASHLDEIQRLSRIVEGLTLLAKADAGQVTLAKEPVRLDELVQDSFADAQILAQPQKIRVDLTACDEVVVRGDRHRLRQLLLNLTDNAIKYNQPQGRVTIALNRNNGTAELKIANTGAGIAPAMLSRVFDRFFRGDSAQSHDAEGSGLGLSIAQWIVSAHGGSIQLVSELNRLTTVTVKLTLT
jgi:heavy metal sensor kinase